MADTRIARASALMAGNGAVLLKMWDVFMLDLTKDGWAEADAPIIVALGAVSLLGIATGYAMLLDQKNVRMREVSSIFAFLAPLILFAIVVPHSN